MLKISLITQLQIINVDVHTISSKSLYILNIYEQKLLYQFQQIILFKKCTIV